MRLLGSKIPQMRLRPRSPLGTLTALHQTPSLIWGEGQRREREWSDGNERGRDGERPLKLRIRGWLLRQSAPVRL